MKKTLIFSVLLVLTVFLVSSCAPEARFSRTPSSSIPNPQGGGGSSGGSTIGCYTNEDCPPDLNNFCVGDQACIEHTYYECVDSVCSEYITHEGCDDCNNGCEDGICLLQPMDEITYFDPTNCDFKWIENYNGTEDYTYVTCEPNQFIGKVTLMSCDRRDTRLITATGHYAGWLPHEIAYSCADYLTGELSRPGFVAAYCCDVKNLEAPRGAYHKTVLNEDGTVTRT